MIAGGVETVSRYRFGRADTGSPNGRFNEAQSAAYCVLKVVSQPGRRARVFLISIYPWAKPRRM